MCRWCLRFAGGVIYIYIYAGDDIAMQIMTHIWRRRHRYVDCDRYAGGDRYAGYDRHARDDRHAGGDKHAGGGIYAGGEI